jgi:hypothetical protein
MLDHSLRQGTANKKCTFFFMALTKTQTADLTEQLATLDAELARTRLRAAQRQAATAAMTLPERPRPQRGIAASFARQRQDEIVAGFLRMIVMTACRSGFIESTFMREWFRTTWNFTPPSRSTLMGPRLDELYADTMRKVQAYCNFNDPDSLCTLSMDGWTAPNGMNIRVYMVLLDGVAFMWTCTENGAERMTGAWIILKQTHTANFLTFDCHACHSILGEAIGEQAVGIIREIGTEHVAALTTDNCPAETTSWDTITDAIEHIVCTGCSTHCGNLLFGDVCEHAWAANLIAKALTLVLLDTHSLTHSLTRIP